MSEGTTSQGRGLVAAFAIGGLVGAGIALMFAPYSGKETRDLLAARTKELKEKAEGVFSDAKEMILEKKSKIIAAVEAGKEAMCEQEPKPLQPA